MDLLESANLSTARGLYTSFTDNFYKSIALAKELFIKHGQTLCGTIVPADKELRQDIGYTIEIGCQEAYRSVLLDPHLLLSI